MATNDAGLLRAIHSRPRDDAPRRVYADWLLEREDPRGEFINLQLASPSDPKRENKLLKAHGKKWLGPFQLKVLRKPVFKRGFVAGGVVMSAALPSASDLDEWATLDDLGYDFDGFSKLAAGCAFVKAVRAASRLSVNRASNLLEQTGTFAVEHLVTSVGDEDEFAALVASKSFPKLRRLELSWNNGSGFEDPSWLDDVKRVSVKELRLHINPPRPSDPANWLANAKRLGLERLELECNDESMWVQTRDSLSIEQFMEPKLLTAQLAALPVDVLQAAKLEGGAVLPATTAPAKTSQARFSCEHVVAAAWTNERWWFADSRSVTLVDPKSRKAVRSFKVTDAERALFVGDQVACQHGDGAVQLYSLATGKKTKRLDSSGVPEKLVASADRRFLIVAMQLQAQLFDLTTGKWLKTEKRASSYYSAAITADGGRWAVQGDLKGDALFLHDAKKTRAETFKGDLRKPFFLPDGRLGAVAVDQLVVFDGQTPRKIGKPEFLYSDLVMVGSDAVLLSTDAIVRIDLVTGRERSRKRGWKDSGPLALSPDQTQLLVATCQVDRRMGQVFKQHISSSDINFSGLVRRN